MVLEREVFEDLEQGFISLCVVVVIIGSSFDVKCFALPSNN